MSLVATCQQCGSRFAAAAEIAGTTVACPSCGAALQVPLQSESPPAKKKKKSRWALPVRPPPPPAGHPEYSMAGGDPANPISAPPVAAGGNEKPPQAGEHALLLLPSRKQDEDLVDMTSMVDIVFFLLIFFLVTSLQSLQSVIDLPTPKSEKGVAASGKDAVDYRNDPAYLVVVIDDENNIWLDDEPVPNESALRAMLRSSADYEGRRKGMVVIGSADATHGKLVMVLDAAAEVGISELLFSVTEDAGDF